MANTIDQAVYEKLKATTAVNGVAPVHYMDAPQGTDYPYTVVSKISDPHTPLTYKETLGGDARIQISLFHRNKYDGVDLSRTIWKSVQNFQGAASTIDIWWMRVTNERALILEDQDIYQFVTDVMVEYVDP